MTTESAVSVRGIGRAKWPALLAKRDQGAASAQEHDVDVVQGTGPRGLLVTLFFDRKTGLLLRELRMGNSPIGRIPTQIDYADYRELPGLGVKIPFSRTLTQTYMQMTLQFTEVQPNVAIDAAKFGKPAPAKLQSEK